MGRCLTLKTTALCFLSFQTSIKEVMQCSRKHVPVQTFWKHGTLIKFTHALQIQKCILLKNCKLVFVQIHFDLQLIQGHYCSIKTDLIYQCNTLFYYYSKLLYSFFISCSNHSVTSLLSVTVMLSVWSWSVFCCFSVVLSAHLSASLHDVSLTPSPFPLIQAFCAAACLHTRTHTLTDTYGYVWSHQFPPPVLQIGFFSELFIAVAAHSTMCIASWPVLLPAFGEKGQHGFIRWLCLCPLCSLFS